MSRKTNKSPFAADDKDKAAARERDYIERMRRLYGIEMIAGIDTRTGFFAKQAGRSGRWHFHEYPSTNLVTCEVCGFTSTPKKVSTRNDCWNWNNVGQDRWFENPRLKMCMSCWNKIRPIVKRAEQAEENRKMINRIERAISNERKNQNHRRTSGLPCNDDARS